MEFPAHPVPATSPTAGPPAGLLFDLLALLRLGRCGAPG
jgi:hypothetical protein